MLVGWHCHPRGNDTAGPTVDQLASERHTHLSINTAKQTELSRLVVIGAGAVGGGIGGLLHESGLPVVLVARGAHGEAIRNDGLSIRLTDRAVVVRAACCNRIDQVDWRPGDVAMLATKLQDAERAIDDLLAATHADVPVVCATNGLQAEPWAAERFTTVVSMVVWMPATHLVPGEVRMHGAGGIGVLDCGPYSGDAAKSVAEALCARLRAAGFDAIARDDVIRWKYAKLITNLGSAAGAMVVDDPQRVIDAAQAEGEAVLAAANIDRVPTDEFLQRGSALRIGRVDGQRREGGSTWQSRKLGKPLETPWLEGALADLAERVGVPAPINRFLAEAAKAPRDLTAREVLGG